MMHALRHLAYKFREIFAANYGLIAFICAIFVASYSLLQCHVNAANCNFDSWLSMLSWLLATQNLSIRLMLAIVVIKVLIVLFMTMWSFFNVMQYYPHVSPARIKRRYRRNIFLRLVADLDQLSSLTGQELNEEQFVELCARLSIAIRRFRRDAQRLFEINDIELGMQVEELFYVNPQQEQYLRLKGYTKMGIRVTDELIWLMLQH